MGTAHADDAALENRTPAVRADAEHATSPYPARWCIEHFLARTHRSARAGLPIRRSSPAAAGPLSLTYAADSVPAPYFAPDSLINRLIEHRSWRMATLWTDRHRALYFGIDEHGYLGVSLGEASGAAD